MVVFYILLGLIGFILFVQAISVFIGVPFLPTHLNQAKHMVKLAGIKPGMKVVDLGSGAGRLMFLAAAAGAEVVGYELNPFLVVWTRLMISVRRLGGKTRVRLQSIYTADVKDADVVLAFLFEEPMKKLESKLFQEMKPGAKIVSYTFPFAQHEPARKEQGVMVYEVK